MLTIPIPGEAIRADLVREIVEAVRANTVQAGPGILVDRGPSGTVVSIQGEEAEQISYNVVPDEIVLAKITGGTAAGGYTVALHADGLHAESTGTGVLHVPECAADGVGNLPVGSVVIAHAIALTITGGGE